MNDAGPERGALLTRGLIAAAGLAVVAAACGSSSHSSTTAGTGPSSVSNASGSASAATYTVSAKSVGNLGTALVNGQGTTLYLLSSEKGGKITCTDANGCTKIWPPVELPSGVTQPVAGGGIDTSKLGTVKTATGDLYVTYGGWPLYTYSGDTAAGTANGVGITSFGGTWYAISTSGSPVTASGASATTAAPTTSSSGGAGGGGY